MFLTVSPTDRKDLEEQEEGVEGQSRRFSASSSSSLGSSISKVSESYDYDSAELAMFKATTSRIIEDFDAYSCSRHSVLADIGLEIHELKQALG